MGRRRILGGPRLGMLGALLLVGTLASCAPQSADLLQTIVPDWLVQSPAELDPRDTPADEPKQSSTYLNEDHGFSFRYPSDWDLIEGRNFVSLNRGSISLVVGYRHVSEDPNLCCSEYLPEGEVLHEGTVSFLGEDIPRAIVRCGDRTKAVLYESADEVGVGDLRFLFYLADFGADQDAADVPRDVQDEADRVIESLATFGVAQSFATATPAPTRLPPTPDPTPIPTRVALHREPASPRPRRAVTQIIPNGVPAHSETTTESEVVDTGDAERETPARALAEAGPAGALIRTRPGPDQEVAAMLQPGERAEITGRYINWWQIAYDGSSGWVFNAAVQAVNTAQVQVVDPDWSQRPEPGPPSPPDANGEHESPVPGAAIAEALSGGANVRTGPAFRFNRVGFLQGGERVQITGWHAEWWQIAYEDEPAWVYSGVVRAYGAGSVPEVVAAPTLVPRMPDVVPPPASPEAIDEERWIDVSLSEQRLTAYHNGEPVRTTLISTGRPQTPTPTGQFRIWIKLRYDTMTGPGYHLPNVPYAMYFYGCYGMHGTYWHSNFGHPMSAGCVNLPTPEAAWVYDFVDIGTLVNVRP